MMISFGLTVHLRLGCSLHQFPPSKLGANFKSQYPADKLLRKKDAKKKENVFDVAKARQINELVNIRELPCIKEHVAKRT
jgi:hypothetical protein